MASDPRFITLYYGDGEYGCLREFFPPMSPDVLDAALALLLDELFDQIPLARVTDLPLEDQGLEGSRRAPTETLFSTDRLERTFSSTENVQDPERAIFETVRSLWQRADQQGAVWDEDQLARVFLQPLLRSLGWSTKRSPR